MMRPVTWSGSPAKWLWFTAILELVLAGVFLVVGVLGAGSGMLLTGAILGITGVLLALWARRWQKGYAEAQRIRATGVAGSARILGMRQTGVYMNEQPQIELNLEVTSSMQGPYQVVMKEYVPLMLLGTLSSGQPLPVKVDPANPNNVIIEWENAMSGGTMAAAPAMAGAPTIAASADSSQMDPTLRQAEKERLLASGVEGTATVMSSKATGQTDSEGRPVYDLMLRIEIPGRQPVQGPARTGVPPDRVDRLEAGDTVTIKADPANPSSMTIDW